MDGNYYTFDEWFEKLPYAWGKPLNSGKIKSFPEDFKVSEILPFVPSGEGEHCYLRIAKRQLNTDEVVRKLAKLAQVRTSDIGYAGLKDKAAISEQWFSVHLPQHNQPDWSELCSDKIELLEQTHHLRKLRIGALTGNKFSLVVRDIQGCQSQITDRLAQIKNEGVPNYFGEQRFGNMNTNLNRAVELFTGTSKLRKGPLRSIVISAARSFLFNQILAERINNRTWNQLIHGDVMILDGSTSFFAVDAIDETLIQRLRTLDIHPSGALWGGGNMPVDKTCRYLEINTLSQFPLFLQGLEKLGLKQERRALRVKVADLTWHFIDATTLQIEFVLPPGSYATMVLRELFG